MNDPTSIFIIKDKKITKQVEDFIKEINQPQNNNSYQFESPNGLALCHVTKEFVTTVDSFLNNNNNFFYKDIKAHLNKTFSKVDNVALSGYLNHKNYHKRKYYNSEINSTLTIWSRLD